MNRNFTDLCRICMSRIKTFPKISPLVFFMVLVFGCAGMPQAVKGPPAHQEYPKSYTNGDFLFRWEYDLTGEKEIIVRGMARNINGYKFEDITLKITGLDAEGSRLATGLCTLVDLDRSEEYDFEIKITKTGGESSFLFTYEYKFYLEGRATHFTPSGPNPITGWFRDKPEQSFKPEMVVSPPPYSKGPRKRK